MKLLVALFILKFYVQVNIFKSKVDYTKYRPISLLSNIEKVIEKRMYKRLSNFLYINNLIYSATHALINLTESNGQIRDAIYL